MDIVNHKIIVVGGSSGMGLVITRAAQAKGAEVVVVGRSVAQLERVALEMSEAGRVKTIAADATREDDVSRLFEQVGSFDHLVVTAASNLAYPTIRELDLDAARQTIDAKLVAALLLSKYAARYINKQGSITFTAGIAAERPLPTGFLVAAVNGALFSLAYGLALALAPVRVNAISPGWVDTPTWDRIFGSRKATMIEQMEQRLPTGHIGRPADIAHGVLFLMENEFTTGTVLQIDGGHRLV
ncbi:MAG TPA: SDR family oxidoreductase [Ktedonobacterales bacterium]|nr:SDR family oxidoreductase [Ktedonobacterales bacterium]